MNEYAFDVKIFAAIRVQAKNEEQARRILDSAQAVNVSLRLDDGTKLIGEASTDGEHELFEVNGEFVE